MADVVPLVALATDATLGWPGPLYARIGHPVGGFARIISACAARLNQQDWPDWRRRLGGCATVMMLVAAAGGASLAIAALARVLGGAWQWLLLAITAWPALAQRNLWQHVGAVRRALEAHDLQPARQAVARIVGRDTATLDEAGIARAAIESLAESFCDGVLAPCFWLALGGLPGVWIYKAINTADSLIGHREAPWGPFGWAAARTDDIMNLVPARLAGVLICLVGGGGWGVLWRDRGAHLSPNAGWSEAAVAGALRIRLGGPLSYDGIVVEKPWLGDGARASAQDLSRAMAIYLRACVGLWVLVLGAAWLR